LFRLAFTLFAALGTGSAAGALALEPWLRHVHHLLGDAIGFPL
jgi:hypothetical protein